MNTSRYPCLCCAAILCVAFGGCASVSSNSSFKHTFAEEAYSAKLLLSDFFEITNVDGNTRSSLKPLERIRFIPGDHNIDFVVKDHEYEGSGRLEITVAPEQVLRVTAKKDQIDFIVSVWDISKADQKPLLVSTMKLPARQYVPTELFVGPGSP